MPPMLWSFVVVLLSWQTYGGYMAEREKEDHHLMSVAYAELESETAGHEHQAPRTSTLGELHPTA